MVGRFLEKVLDDKHLQPRYLKKYPKPSFDFSADDLSGGQSYSQRDTSARDSVAYEEDFTTEEAVDTIYVYIHVSQVNDWSSLRSSTSFLLILGFRLTHRSNIFRGMEREQ